MIRPRTDSSSASSTERRVSAVLVGVGLVCVAIGASVLIAPETAGRLVGFAFPNPEGLVEFTVMYGGFYAGFGLFLLDGARNDSLRSRAAVILAYTASGAALGRGVVMALYATWNLALAGLLAAEIAMAAAGWVATDWARRRHHDE